MDTTKEERPGKCINSMGEVYLSSTGSIGREGRAICQDVKCIIHLKGATQPVASVPTTTAKFLSVSVT